MSRTAENQQQQQGFEGAAGGHQNSVAGQNGGYTTQGMPRGYTLYQPAVGSEVMAAEYKSPPVTPLSAPSSSAFNHFVPRTFQEFVPRSATAQQTPLQPRSTLWWGELEPWMDDEYAKQVCDLMHWDNVNVKVPHPAPDAATGQQPNNPGYCFLTFPTQAHAASVLAQINTPAGPPVTMPNSSKPFVLNWASSVPATPLSTSFPPTAGPAPATQYPREYSIFVGDLAPETSNSDLVSVFRNPVLGLRNDREPKIIRPFASCKSAKIMLDPVTGVSRGYGFVRFTDEADQQRALIEMHGLYCLSRPMRISPATAKFKPPPAIITGDMPQVQFPLPVDQTAPQQQTPQSQQQQVAIALPLPPQTKSVSAPIASVPSVSSLPSLSSGSSVGTMASSPSEDLMNLPHNVLAHIAQQYANGAAKPAAFNADQQQPQAYIPDAQQQQQRYSASDESWKNHATSRAILGNLIGPNGEQLTSTDPYNTTVFVGGLSPLISEQTLTTFFAPFGDIHYVKVPVGKHCGFVQFVRKADAERAIEKMQGFPVGGSRIRLSWGRSQYKAAQAAAQAQQATELATQQAQSPAAPAAIVTPSVTSPSALPQMTHDQVVQLLQQMGYIGIINPTPQPAPTPAPVAPAPAPEPHAEETTYRPELPTEEKVRLAVLATRDGTNGTPLPYEAYNSTNAFGQRPSSIPLTMEPLPPAPSSRMEHPRQNRSQALSMSTFSPFSPDQSNLFASENKRRESAPFLRTDLLPHPSKSFAPGFGPEYPGSGKVSPTTSNGLSSSSGPGSQQQRYGAFLDSSFQSRTPAPISRPSSGPREYDQQYHHHRGEYMQQQQHRPELQHEYSNGPPRDYSNSQPPREYSSQPREYSSYGREQQHAPREYSQPQDREYGHGRQYDLQHEQDLIQDLNGTLASLDLDQTAHANSGGHSSGGGPQWKAPTTRSSPESTSSPFRMAQRHTPSP